MQPLANRERGIFENALAVNNGSDGDSTEEGSTVDYDDSSDSKSPAATGISSLEGGITHAESQKRIEITGGRQGPDEGGGAIS